MFRTSDILDVDAFMTEWIFQSPFSIQRHLFYPNSAQHHFYYFLRSSRSAFCKITKTENHQQNGQRSRITISTPFFKVTQKRHNQAKSAAFAVASAFVCTVAPLCEGSASSVLSAAALLVETSVRSTALIIAGDQLLSPWCLLWKYFVPTTWAHGTFPAMMVWTITCLIHMICWSIVLFD